MQNRKRKQPERHDCWLRRAPVREHLWRNVRCEAAGLVHWRGKIMDLGGRNTIRRVLRALSALPLPLSERCAKAVSRIVVLPATRPDLDMDGASFDSSRAILVFESSEEELTTLHEIAHVVDPGWEDDDLAIAIKADLAALKPEHARKLRRNCFLSDVREAFAELSARLLLGDRTITKHLPRSAAVAQAALNAEV